MDEGGGEVGGEAEAPRPPPQADVELEASWAEEQRRLRQQVVEEDDVSWIFDQQDEEGEEDDEGERDVKGSSGGRNCGERDGQSEPLPRQHLRYLGGVDISFVKGSNENACASLVVLSWPSLEVVWEAFDRVTMREPYIPGFLAFREVGHLLPLFDRLKVERPDLQPDVVICDGNGVLHPRAMGLASHLGVLTGHRCVGLAKNFLQMDGMTKESVMAQIEAAKCPQERAAVRDTAPEAVAVGDTPPEAVAIGGTATAATAAVGDTTPAPAPSEVDGSSSGSAPSANPGRRRDREGTSSGKADGDDEEDDHKGRNEEEENEEGEEQEQEQEQNYPLHVLLQGASGRMWGAALLLHKSLRRPVFVSVGHRVSLRLALRLVGTTSRFRVPEPVRQADLRSRAVVRQWEAEAAAAEAAAGGGGGAEAVAGADDAEEGAPGEAQRLRGGDASAAAAASRGAQVTPSER